MSDRIVILRDGRAIQTGSPEQLYEHPRTRFVADFLGRSNFLTARVMAVTDEYLTLDASGIRLVQRRMDERIRAGGDSVLLALRRYKFVIGDKAVGPSGENRLQGRVKTVIYIGAHASITVETLLRDYLIVTQPIASTRRRPAPGDHVPLAWDSAAAVIVADD